MKDCVTDPAPEAWANGRLLEQRLAAAELWWSTGGKEGQPALLDGALHWSWQAWVSPAPRRGEVWLVEGPQGPSVKRILGLPGELVRWEGGDLWVNDRRLDEPWVAHPERSGGGRQACGSGYLVLGDNRPASQDGRSWGPLPAGAMRGRLLGNR